MKPHKGENPIRTPMAKDNDMCLVLPSSQFHRDMFEFAH